MESLWLYDLCPVGLRDGHKRGMSSSWCRSQALGTVFSEKAYALASVNLATSSSGKLGRFRLPTDPAPKSWADSSAAGQPAECEVWRPCPE